MPLPTVQEGTDREDMDEPELLVVRPAVPVDPQPRPAAHAERVDNAAFSACYREFTPTLVAWLICRACDCPWRPTSPRKR